MAHSVRVDGDELVFIREPRDARFLPAALWFFIAGCVFILSLLPLGNERRVGYAWGACSVVWLISAAAGFAGVVVLKTSKGITFDRKKGVVVEWKVRFGRRSERRRPLGAFHQLQVRTWLSKHSRSSLPFLRDHAIYLVHGPPIPPDNYPEDRRLWRRSPA